MVTADDTPAPKNSLSLPPELAAIILS